LVAPPGLLIIAPVVLLRKRKMPCTLHTQHTMCDTTDYIYLAPKYITSYNSKRGVA